MSVLSPTENETVGNARYWQDLQTLLRRSPKGSDFKLKQPPPVALPAGYKVTTTSLLRSCNSNRQRRLLNRHLLSCLALFDTSSRKRQPFPDIITTQDLFLEIDHTTFASTSWIAVPVPVIQGSSATILTVMLGLVSGKGRMHVQRTPCIDESSRKALEIAFHSPFLSEIDKDKDLLVWTLQNEDSTPLKGASLGLPAAIGLYLLHNQKPWPHGFFASGEITAAGRIKSVQHIKEKTQILSRELQLFVIPELNNFSEGNTKHLPVQTVREAFFAINCFLEGIHDKNSILIFQLAINEPEILLSQFKRLPVEFFRLYDLSNVLKRIRRTPEKYLTQLASCLRENSYKIEQADLLVSLFTCEDIELLAATDGYNAIKYCLGSLALQNHSGNIEKSKKWSACAGKIAASLNCKKELSQLVNNDFVSDRFNRYDFQTQVPTIFSKCLEHEIKLHDLQEDDSWQLGAMYGTLAQNYGFCGPEYLGNLREMTQKAIETFGTRHPNEHSRILSYLVYALLDNHKFVEAKAVLLQYLDLPQSTTAHDWINNLTESQVDKQHGGSFKICLVFRFLAEQQELLSADILNSPSLQNLTYVTLQQNKHPWQLTATNLARFYIRLKKENLAEQLLIHAVTICLNNGETLQAMALLPLSILHQHDLAKKKQYQQAEQILEMICSNNILKQSHFTDILSCQTGQAILEETINKRSSLFPFSYR